MIEFEGWMDEAGVKKQLKKDLRQRENSKTL